VRYFIDPFGCAKNQVDAENMMSHLNNAGWDPTQDAETADLIIVNSCGFIESAKIESINAVLDWRARYPGKKIMLAGCLAIRYPKELAESLPEADFLFNDEISRIVAAACGVCAPAPDSDIHQKITYAKPLVHGTGHRPLLSMPGSAYVKISDGCDNRCSYCAIPLIRGGLVCRDVPDIVEECRTLLERGIKELCLVGQDIGSYYSNGGGLPELLDKLSSLPGHFWVRLLYIHPDHFPLKILDTIERDRRFLPYFDIPFQHASDRILRAMNRKGSAESNCALVETIRGRLPDAVIRSTFLLGFPGETDKDFLALCNFQDKVKLDWLGCFAYSREDGTPAWSMPGQVPPRTAARRVRIIEERQIPITEANMKRFIGHTLDALIEEPFTHNSGAASAGSGEIMWLGRLYCQAPEVDGIALVSGGANRTPGELVPCTVITRRGFDLEVKTAE
jgi:ribosomal protein S12 methylthiotransferase